MRWQTQQRYPCDRGSPRRARSFCADQLRSVLGSGGAATVQDAVLVVSELVTNAVNAGCSSTTVELSLHRTHLRLAVHDDAPGRPLQRPAAATEEHGRGLLVVEQVARDWGVQAELHGKVVWAELPVPVGLGAGINAVPANAE
jgi:anti-sigma regulatory factor (Ser/Thr protein kinase)